MSAITFEVKRSPESVGAWEVRAVDRDSRDEVYRATFVGTTSEERAQEYAEWKTRQEDSAALCSQDAPEIVVSSMGKESSPRPSLAPIEWEALELASKSCVGNYTTDHILALRRLKDQGLVRSVRGARSAWYELTVAGRNLLTRSHPVSSALG